MVIASVLADPVVSDVFTDVIGLLTNLGVYGYVTAAIQATIVLGVSAALLRFIR